MDVCLSLNHHLALYVSVVFFYQLPCSSLTSVFLPASDIPSFVGKGNVDLGITGHDVILEAQMENLVTEELRLGFGKCSLQVQVPEASPITTVEDLTGKRIVTSFEVLAGQFFDKLDDKLGLSGDKKTQIDYVGGSVEAACALGLADGIGAFNILHVVSSPEAHPMQLILLVSKVKQIRVDLSFNALIESGDTMRAAGLRSIATMLQTEAVLIRSRTPKHPNLTPLINLVTKRIAGVVAANKYVVCQFNISRDKLAAATKIAPGRKAPTVSPLEEEGWVAVSSMIEKKNCANTMDDLVNIGAEDVLIFNLDNCR